MSHIIREEGGRFVIRLDKETEADIARLEKEPTRNFNAMVKAARLDPRTDFKFSNFSGISLAGADIRGFDFSESRLNGCQISKTKFDKTTIFNNAILDLVDFELIRNINRNSSFVYYYENLPIIQKRPIRFFRYMYILCSVDVWQDEGLPIGRRDLYKEINNFALLGDISYSAFEWILFDARSAGLVYSIRRNEYGLSEFGKKQLSEFELSFSSFRIALST